MKAQVVSKHKIRLVCNVYCHLTIHEHSLRNMYVLLQTSIFSSHEHYDNFMLDFGPEIFLKDPYVRTFASNL